ncbi:MAG: DUF4259 domain-containing protein [Phycisphaeraceae bacterium]|nr:DUF4259 domain-containing protein [Phycisphaeraceae bacterium]
MGTWGPGVFEDDTALDAAAEFRELIAQGLSPEAATARVLEEMDTSDVFGEQPSLWFGLAAEQVKLGRLVEEVRAKSLELIDSGADLQAWRDVDAKFLRKRRKALARLRKKLVGKQRKPKRVKARTVHRTGWQVGDVLAYRLRSGRWVVMRVIGVEGDPDTSAIVDLCEWAGEEPNPPPDILAGPRKGRLGFEEELRSARESHEAEHREYRAGTPPHIIDLTERSRKDPDLFRRSIERMKTENGKFALPCESERGYPEDRFRRIAQGVAVHPGDMCGAFMVPDWKALDEFLEDMFGVK